MPSHDPVPGRSRNSGAFRIAQIRAAAERFRARRRRKPGSGGEAVPVEPNRPNTLSGGAAAALEFDD